MSVQESGKVLVVSLSLVVAFAASAYGWFYYQDVSARQEQHAKALRSATIELSMDTLNRESAGLALRQVQKVLLEQPSLDDGVPPADELIRKLAGLQLALGQTAAAWDSIEAYVISPESQAADLWVGALASSSRYARRGTSNEGLMAFGLARRHYQMTDDLKSLYLAALLAYRLGEIAAFCELHEALLAQHADSREGRLFTALGYSLGVHLSQRIGFIGDAEALEELAGSTAENDRARLARLRLNAAKASAAGDLSALEALEGEFESVPAELLVVIAEALIGRPGASLDDLAAGLQRAEQSLEDFPSYLEARHVAAVIHFGLSREALAVGDTARAESEMGLCQGLLRWLSKNAGPDDSRRANWRAMQR